MADRPTIDQLFYKHLTAEDELGVVVRAHIHIESNIGEFVTSLVRFPDQLPRLQYESKLRLACALGLRHVYFEPLKLLGDIRNGFGHRLDATLTEERINELFSKLPDEAQQLALQAYDMTIRQRGEQDPPKFSALSPKDRFVLIAVVLKSFLTAAVHKVRTKPKST